MGDTNNNRTSTVVRTRRKSSDGDFDISSLLSKHALDSTTTLPEQNKESNSKYPNFWPTPATQIPTSKSQQPSFSSISPINRSPKIIVKETEKLANGKFKETTLRDMSPEQLSNEGIEWIRIIKTPVSPSASTASDDEFILRCLTAESNESSSSSIRWAEDAVESEWTEKLQKQWDAIEQVCTAPLEPSKPSQMTETIYNECLEWRRAFPHQYSLRSSSHNRAKDQIARETPRDLMPIRSSTPFDDPQDYVHSWLNQCQPTSSGFSSLPTQLPTIKTKEDDQVVGEKSQFEESRLENPRRIESWSPPSDLLEYRSRIKVQRPISSHVRGHTITPISTGFKGNRTRKTISKDSSLLVMIDEHQLSQSTNQKSPVENHTVIWSRYDQKSTQDETKTESMKTEINSSRGRLGENSTSFVNWLFLDNTQHS